MDYRMYSGGAPAGEDVVELIREDLKSHGFKCANLKLDFIGFEAPAGTSFKLNDDTNSMVVPSNGKFITPYDGERYLTIRKFVFDQGFSGNIYYII